MDFRYFVVVSMIIMTSAVFAVDYNSPADVFTFNDQDCLDDVGSENCALSGDATYSASGVNSYGVDIEASTAGYDYIDFYNSGTWGSPFFTNDFCISFWVKPEDTDTCGSQTNCGSLLWKSENNFELNFANDFLDYNAGGKISTVNRWISSTNEPISIGSWNHIIQCKSSSAGQKIYVNGVLNGVDALATGAWDSQSDSAPWSNRFGNRGTLGEFDGMIDEIYFYSGVLNDDSCAITETCGGDIAALYSGSTRFYPFVSSNNPPSSPNITNPPNDYDINNTNVTIVWNTTDPEGDTVYSIIWVNGSQWVNTTSLNWTTNFTADGNYSISIGAHDNNSEWSLNNDSVNITIDTVNPILNWTSQDQVNVVSNIDAYYCNVTGTDENLYGLDLRLSYTANGTEIDNLTKINIDGESYSSSLPWTLKEETNYTCNATVSDGHTKNIISPANSININLEDKSITYHLKGNDIIIELTNNNLFVDDINTIKLDDKYTFQFITSGSNALLRYDYKIYSKTPIVKVRNTDYKGHIVLGNKYWMDFEGQDIEAVDIFDTNKEGDWYTIEIRVIAKKKDPQFDSIGELNIVSEQRTYYYDPTPPVAYNFVYTPLNSSKDPVNAWNSSYFIPIEFAQLNFSIVDNTSVNNFSIYYTANGTNGCATGNKQSSTCYNLSTGYIHFVNGSETATFKDEGNQGDFINVTCSGNTTYKDCSVLIDEHYNPNINKWYNAGFNFSDVKYQTEASKRIRSTNYLLIDMQQNTPSDADFYKLDFRLQTVNNPTQPLEAWGCNASYTTGNVLTSPNCELITELTPSQLQDSGTKFRGLFTSDYISILGMGKYILLRTDEVAPDTYYAIKTYKAENGSHPAKIQYSNNNGASYTTNTDGYETEMNINHFYNNTGIVFQVQTDDGFNFQNNSFSNNWIIGGYNYPPLVSITTPLQNAVVQGSFYINCTVNDPNVTSKNITLSTGDLSYDLATNLSICSTYIDSTLYTDAYYDVNITACENTTTEEYCGTDSHNISINNYASISITNPLNSTYTNEQLELTYTYDSDFYNCWYSLDNGTSNSSPGSCTGTFGLLNTVNNTQTWAAYINDSLGNIGLDYVTFTANLDYDPDNVLVIGYTFTSDEEVILE